MLVIALALTSCSTLASLIGFDGLAGFDSQSKKELDQGFTEIPWLSGNEDLKSVVSSLCESGHFSVSYSDRRRMLEFVAINSNIRMNVYSNRIEFEFNDTLYYSEYDGWYAPQGITLECYGVTYSERLNSGDVERTDKREYNKLLNKYIDYKYEEVTHAFSQEAGAFLAQNWSNNDLYVTVYGRRDNVYRIKNNDLVNLYRAFYEALFPYEFISGAAEGAIVEFIDGLTVVDSYQASAINNYLYLNVDLTNDQIRSLSNLVNSKIR